MFRNWACFSLVADQMPMQQLRLLATALLLLLALPRGGHGFGINLLKVPTEDRGQTACTVALLRKYFDYGDSLSGAVLSMRITASAINVQEQLLRHMNSYEGYPWTVVVSNPRARELPSGIIMHEKPQCYFLVVENLEDVDLDEIFDSWKGAVNWNPLAQFVVYLASVEETEEEMTDLMVELLLSFMNKKIFNVNLIGQSEESTLYYGKTVFPYHPDNNCGNRVITVELLDSCDYQLEEHEEEEDEDDEEHDDDVNLEADENGEDESENRNAGDGVEDEQGQPEGDDNFEEKPEEEAKIEAEKESKTESSSEVIDKEQDKFDTQDKSDSAVESETLNDGDIDDSQENTRPVITNAQFKESSDELSSHETDALEESASSEVSKINNNTNQPKLIVKEYFRAKFTDKFPKDLSGCPLTAAYRPWEPYIFSTKEESEADDYDDSDTGGEDEGNETATAGNYGDNYGDAAENGEYDASEDMDSDHVLNRVDSADAGGVSGKSKLTGIEYQMVQAIAERLHVNVDMQMENTNVYHLFQQLIDGEIEMIVGGIDEDPSISQFVSSSITYYQDDLTWCVAKAKRQHSFFNFLASFEPESWALLIVYIIVASLAIYIAQRVSGFRISNLYNISSICIRITGIILSQAMNTYGLPLVLRMLFVSSFLMGFFFSNTYQSFLISTLTTPRSSYQISHLAEIYSNRMTIMGSVDNVRHLNKDGEIFKYIREKFQMCYNIVDCLKQAAEDDNIAVAVSRQHAFYNPHIPRDRLYCFDRNENVYVYLVTMLLPKKFHLLHQINPIIQHIIESGHTQKWARDLDMVRKIHEEIQRVREDPFKALTLAQFIGAFVFASGLLLLASLIFCLEWLAYWSVVKRRTRLKLLRQLHRRFRTQ